MAYIKAYKFMICPDKGRDASKWDGARYAGLDRIRTGYSVLTAPPRDILQKCQGEMDKMAMLGILFHARPNLQAPRAISCWI